MNLIFDIGNVICEWNPEALVARLFDSAGQGREALKSIINHPDWISLDKGLIEVDQAVSNAAARSFLDAEAILRIYQETPPSLVPIEPMVAAIRDLKSRGYPLFTLSNMQKHSWNWLFPRYNFWSLFDGIVVSYEIHMVKPDREIFEYTCGRYELDPAATIFLDDIQENIDTARDCGMQTILVSNIQQALNDLYFKLGIDIRDKGDGVGE